MLITGCDTGLGAASARRLQHHGFQVFAGCLSEQGMKQYVDGGKQEEKKKDGDVLPIIPVRLDVTGTFCFFVSLLFVLLITPMSDPMV